jgi:hypothetical protein
MADHGTPDDVETMTWKAKYAKAEIEERAIRHKEHLVEEAIREQLDQQPEADNVNDTNKPRPAAYDDTQWW